jgi:hypothetical protein
LLTLALQSLDDFVCMQAEERANDPVETLQLPTYISKLELPLLALLDVLVHAYVPAIQVVNMEVTAEEIAILGRGQARALSELTDEEIAILTNEDTRLALVIHEFCGKHVSLDHRIVKSIANLMATSCYPRTPPTGALTGMETAAHYNSVVRLFGKLVTATNTVDRALRYGDKISSIEAKVLRFLREIYAVHKSPIHACSFPGYMHQQFNRWGAQVFKEVFDP